MVNPQLPIPIGKVAVGPDQPVVIIAEAACEHLGSLELALRMCDDARAANVDIIKFQLHLPEEMIPNSIHFWGGSMDDVLAQYNLTVEDHRRLIEHCDQIGIQYLCTPFCAAAADILYELGVPAFKTGSGELTNLPMQQHIAGFGRPMIVSTGMATIEEIERTVDVVKREGAPLILTHCTSAYPPRYDQVNLRFMRELTDRFAVPVGFSDHTPEIYTALAAVTLGARVIEKHYTLSRRLRGPDYHVSLEPPELAALVDAVRKTEAALGSEKRIYPEEEVVRAWAHHSVVSLTAIPAGTRLSETVLGVKRPGSGIPARHLGELYDRVAARDIPANRTLVWEDVQN